MPKQPSHATVYADVVHADPLPLPAPAPVIAQGWLMQACIASGIDRVAVVKQAIRPSKYHLGYTGPEGVHTRGTVPNGWVRLRCGSHGQAEALLAELVGYFNTIGVTGQSLATTKQFPVRRWGRQALYLMPMAGTPYYIAVLLCCDQPKRGGFTNPLMYLYAAQPDAEWLAQAAQGKHVPRASYVGGRVPQNSRLGLLQEQAATTEWFWGDGTPVDAGVVLYRMVLGLDAPDPSEAPMHQPPGNWQA